MCRASANFMELDFFDWNRALGDSDLICELAVMTFGVTEAKPGSCHGLLGNICKIYVIAWVGAINHVATERGSLVERKTIAMQLDEPPCSVKGAHHALETLVAGASLGQRGS